MAMMGRYGRWERRVLRPWFLSDKLEIPHFLCDFYGLRSTGFR
jgi:hypothetical protein